MAEGNNTKESLNDVDQVLENNNIGHYVDKANVSLSDDQTANEEHLKFANSADGIEKNTKELVDKGGEIGANNIKNAEVAHSKENEESGLTAKIQKRKIGDYHIGSLFAFFVF